MSALDALQATLAGEHAALYTYGVLGARTSASASPDLFETLTVGYRRHRSRRDRLRLLVEEAGGTPVPAAAAYVLDEPLVRPDHVEAAALALEDAGTAAMLALVARTSGSVRAWALTEATWSATWQLQLGGEPATWPGAPELD